jgi:hypothetical protein
MTPRARFLRFASIALLSIGLFSLVFSLLAENGLWPGLPSGALHGTDRIAGFVAAIGLVIVLAKKNRSEPSAGSAATRTPERRGVPETGESSAPRQPSPLS